MDTKRASAAKMTRSFPCKVVLLNQVLQQRLPSPKAYISEKDVLDIFHPDVISTSTVKKSFDEVTSRLRPVHTTKIMRIKCAMIRIGHVHTECALT